jgi:hypothetical protein
MNWILIFGIALVVFVLFNSKNTENFWSRPNKCFSCEKQITSIADAHLAFPSKCFSCEKQSGQIPYNTGPTKCFDCENLNKKKCENKLNDVGNYFTSFGRNIQIASRF